MEDIHVPCRAAWCVEISPLPKEIQSEITSFEDTDLLHLRVITKDYVVLGSAKAISDLMEKRSNMYSDRVSRLKTFTPIRELTMWFQPTVPMIEL
jgi:hypothetical protein